MSPPTVPSPSIFSRVPLQSVPDSGQIMELLITDHAFRFWVTKSVLEDLDLGSDPLTMQRALDDKLSNVVTRLATMADLSGTTTQITGLETKVFKPEGAITHLKSQFKYLKDRCSGNIVKRCGMQFKDQWSVQVLITAVGEESLAQF